MKKRYELMICVGGNCSPEDGKESFKYLKKRVKELALNNVSVESKSCLGICALGPTLLVLPEGTWYHFARKNVIDQILREHIIGGNPVEEFAFAIKTKE